MDNRRLIVLCIFSFSLVMLWDAWQKFNQPKAPATVASAPATAGSSAVPTPSSGVPATTATEMATPAAVPAPASAALKGEIVEIKTDLFVARVAAQGGDLVGLELAKYKATEDKSKQFMLFDPKHQYFAQSGLIGENLPNHKTMFNIVPGKRELASGEDVIELRLEAPAAGGVKVTKVYTFKRGSYLINVAYEIDNGGQRELTSHAYYQLQRDTQTPAGESSMVSTFTGPAVYTEQSKFQKIDFKDIAKGNPKFEKNADTGWMAMVQHYFVSAWVPQEKLQREYYVRKLEGGVNPAIAAGLIVPVQPVAPGAKASFASSLYAGPQIQSTLDQLAKPVAEGGIGAQGLPLVVDYGWLTIVAAPIFWFLEFIHKIVGNWGWAIIFLTICIKAVFFPLSAASYKSMAKMRAITPRLPAFKERCGDDTPKLHMVLMPLY